MTFEAAVDRWIIWVMAFSVAMMLGAGIAAGFDPDMTVALAVILWGTNLGILALVWVLAVPVRYRIEDGQIEIRSGMLRTTLMIRDLVRVAPHTSFVSSTTAAWTRHRILLKTRQGRAVDVGPKDQVGFIAEILAWGPHLTERLDGRRRIWVDPTA